MLKIYGVPTLNTIKVILTAEQLELAYDYIPMDLGKQEHKTPEHLARHPLGKVPAIDHDGKYLCESNSLCVYLSDVNNSPLYQGDSYRKAQIHQWIDMMSLHMGRWLGVYYFENFIKPTILNGTPNENSLKEADGYLDTQLPVLDQHLQNNNFLCGQDMTVADLIGFALVNTHEVSGYSIDGYDGIKQWYRQLRDLSAYGRTVERVGLPG